LSLRTMEKDLGDVPPIFGWKLVPSDPIMAESGPEDGCAVGLNDVLDEPFFNFDMVEQIVGSDNDEFDLAMEVQQTQTIPHTTSKPAEWGSKRLFETTVSRPISSLVRRPQTHSLGSAATLPLPKDVVKPFVKNPTSKSTKKPTLSLLKEPRDQPKGKWLPNRSPNRLRRLSHQRKGHYLKRERLPNKCLTSLKKLRSQGQKETQESHDPY